MSSQSAMPVPIQSDQQTLTTTSPSLPALASAAGRKVMRLELPAEKGDLLTNYRPDVDADQIDVSRAMAPCDCNMDVYVGKTIRVSGIVMNMAEFESQEVKGEIVEKVYASIVLDDGTVIGTSGKAVMGQLAYLIGTAKNGPFVPPVEFEVRTHKVSPPKKPYYSIRRVKPAQGESRKGKANAS
jgi:hypothetical protein